MATQAEIRQRVGEELSIVPVGQALESQDDARIAASVAEAYAFLKEKGLAGWASTGNVPDKIVPYFVLLVCQKLLVSYSVPESRYVRISQDAGVNGVIAIAKIAELSVQEYTTNDDYQDF